MPGCGRSHRAPWRPAGLIEITPDGRATADQLLPGIRTLERSIASALSPDERACLLNLLGKILTRTAAVAAEHPDPSTAGASGPPGSTVSRKAPSRPGGVAR
jgi:hypothetical protein